MNITELLELASAVDTAQTYFMAVAKNHDGEITLTFKNEEPFVTAFVGPNGDDQKIGFGSSVAEALQSAIYGNSDPLAELVDKVIEEARTNLA